jgi:iron(III) transport system substrate-binding protein
MVYNTKLVTADKAPKSIYDLTDPRWKGKVCLANPLFGTTSTQAAAMYAYLGKEKLTKLFSDLKANGILIVDGNAPALERVVEGLSAIGYTDTDDATVAIKDDKPIAMVFPDKDGMGTLTMPTSVAMIKNCPHPDNAKKLIDYLLSPEVESQLLANNAIQIPCRPSVKVPAGSLDTSSFKAMDISYDKICDSIQDSAEITKETLLK